MKSRLSLAEEIDLHGKCAVVTEGSTGIGKGIALRLAEAGASVLITGRRLEQLQKAAEEISSQGSKAEYLQADIGIASDGKRVADAAMKTFGRINIWINNAADIVPSSALEMTEEQWDEVVNTDMRGVFFYSQAAARKMIENGEGGRIINVISTDALESSTNMINYSTARAGVVMITKAMAKELAKYNILINALAPSATLTEEAIDKINNLKSSGTIDPVSMLNKIIPVVVPLGRIGTPDDLAKAALFLSCGLSSYITGTVLIVDGGRLLGPNL